MIKTIVLCVFLLTSFSFFSQKYITVDCVDTTEVIEILNGKWVMKVEGKKCDFEFHFTKDFMTYSNPNNLDWYFNTPVDYTLEWNDIGRIFLRTNFVKNFGEVYSPVYNEPTHCYPNEIWIINDHAIYLRIGGDFGIHKMKKKRR